MRISKKRSANLALALSTLVLGALGSGCELIVDFNRALIEGGVDAPFSYTDAGDASVQDASSGADAIVVPDAVADVVYAEAAHDAAKDAYHAVEAATDAHHPVEAATDAHHAAEAGADARPDVGVDAKVPDSTVGPDAAHHDAAQASDAKSDAKG